MAGSPADQVPVHPVHAVAVRLDLDPFLDLRALAGYCHLSRRRLQDLLNDLRDPIPSYRVGGKILVRRSSSMPGWPAAEPQELPPARAAALPLGEEAEKPE